MSYAFTPTRLLTWEERWPKRIRMTNDDRLSHLHLEKRLSSKGLSCRVSSQLRHKDVICSVLDCGMFWLIFFFIAIISETDTQLHCVNSLPESSRRQEGIIRRHDHHDDHEAYLISRLILHHHHIFERTNLITMWDACRHSYVMKREIPFSVAMIFLRNRRQRCRRQSVRQPRLSRRLSWFSHSITTSLQSSLHRVSEKKTVITFWSFHFWINVSNTE